MTPQNTLWRLIYATATVSVVALLAGCETVSAPPVVAPAAGLTASQVVFDLKDVDQEPVAIYKMRPRYPTAMRRSEISGEALIRFVVNTEGEVKDARAIEATHKDFAAAAVTAVSGWKFKPGMKNGQPVNTRMQTPIKFTLKVES